MPLPKDLLNDNEELVLDLHPHWWYFAQSVAAAVVVLVLWVAIDVTFSGDFSDLMAKVTGFVFAAVVLWVVWQYLQWRTTHFAVTVNRVIYQQGFFAKSGIEIPLERVNNVNFNQTIIERILGAGDLLIESGGQDGQQKFSDIRRPQLVKKMILERVQMRHDNRGGGSAPTDSATQLEKIEGLLQRGAITRDEFEAEKRKILGL